MRQRVARRLPGGKLEKSGFRLQTGRQDPGDDPTWNKGVVMAKEDPKANYRRDMQARLQHLIITGKFDDNLRKRVSQVIRAGDYDDDVRARHKKLGKNGWATETYRCAALFWRLQVAQVSAKKVERAHLVADVRFQG
jgi:hypothetical protein